MTEKMCEFVPRDDGSQVCKECGLVAPPQAVNPTAVCGNVVVTMPPDFSCRAGLALKRLLARVGIVATANCSCNAKAMQMDIWGCDKCEENTDVIVGWLREEAEKRGLPFLDAAGRLLVKKAISDARKEFASVRGSQRQD
jgi:hypothetical protein